MSNVLQASTAAEVRHDFASQCDSLQTREVGLTMAAQGFKAETKHYLDMATYTRATKRVYSFVFPGGATGRGDPGKAEGPRGTKRVRSASPTSLATRTK